MWADNRLQMGRKSSNEKKANKCIQLSHHHIAPSWSWHFKAKLAVRLFNGNGETAAATANLNRRLQSAFYNWQMRTETRPLIQQRQQLQASSGNKMKVLRTWVKWACEWVKASIRRGKNTYIQAKRTFNLKSAIAELWVNELNYANDIN